MGFSQAAVSADSQALSASEMPNPGKDTGHRHLVSPNVTHRGVSVTWFIIPLQNIGQDMGSLSLDFFYVDAKYK